LEFALQHNTIWDTLFLIKNANLDGYAHWDAVTVSDLWGK